MTSTAHTTAHAPAGDERDGLPTEQLTALAFGVVFGAIGFLGFIPGVSSGFNFSAGLKFSGTASHAMLFHVFATSNLANGILLITGLLGAVSMFFSASARAYFFFAGFVYLFFWVYGLVVNLNGPANFMPFNTASNWLHFALGLALLLTGIGFTVADRRDA